jgi:hypothetical protein
MKHSVGDLKWNYNLVYLGVDRKIILIGCEVVAMTTVVPDSVQWWGFTAPLKNIQHHWTGT